MHQRNLAVASERKFSRKHFKEDNAERPDVGAVIDGQALRLFRGHVSGRSQARAFNGDPLATIAQRQAKIQNVGVPLGRDDDVAALDVTMNDAALVRLFQPFRNLDGNVQRLTDG